MKKIDNNTLSIILIIVIFISILITWDGMMRLQGIIGAATGLGYVNVTVNETVGITMVTNTVNFTSTLPGVSKTTYIATDITSGPFNITNDGTVDINITITDTETLFSSANLNRDIHYLYNVTLAQKNTAVYDCSLNMTLGLKFTPVTSISGWRAFPVSGAETPICGLNYTDGADSVTININITVPNDESSGTKAARVTFTSVATTP